MLVLGEERRRMEREGYREAAERQTGGTQIQHMGAILSSIAGRR